MFEVIERTIDRDGQKLMFPEIEVSTYWTSLGPRQATPDEKMPLVKKVKRRRLRSVIQDLIYVVSRRHKKKLVLQADG